MSLLFIAVLILDSLEWWWLWHPSIFRRQWKEVKWALSQSYRNYPSALSSCLFSDQNICQDISLLFRTFPDRVRIHWLKTKSTFRIFKLKTVFNICNSAQISTIKFGPNVGMKELRNDPRQSESNYFSNHHSQVVPCVYSKPPSLGDRSTEVKFRMFSSVETVGRRRSHHGSSSTPSYSHSSSAQSSGELMMLSAQCWGLEVAWRWMKKVWRHDIFNSSNSRQLRSWMFDTAGS